MTTPLIKLYFVFGAFVLNLTLIPVLGKYANQFVGYALFTLFIVLLPLYVLYSKEALENLANNSKLKRSQKLIAWILACLPALFFGVLATVFGATIIIWVLYNLLIERHPEFSGTAIFGGLGIAPVMLVFGVHTLKSLWIKGKIE